MFLRKAKKRLTELEMYIGGCAFLKDKIAPGCIEETRDYMIFGSNYARTLLVVDYPNYVKGNWLTKLYRFSGNMNVSTHLVPIASDKMIRHLNQSIEEYDARVNQPLSPVRRKETERKRRSAENMLDVLLGSNHKTIFLVHTYLHLQAESLEELNRLTDRLQGVIWKTGLSVVPARDNMLEAFRSVLPICNATLTHYTYQNMHTSAVASMLPFDESELFMHRGIIIGKNLHTDNVVLVDMNDKKRFPSRNMLILGTTGMGKSFFMQKHFLRQWVLEEKETRFYILDPEREFARIVSKIGGQVIRISNNTEHVINPFHILHDTTDDDIRGSVLFLKMQRLKIFFKLIYPDMTVLESALLERALFAVYKRYGITEETAFANRKAEDFPTLGDLYHHIGETDYENLRNFREILRMYTEGTNCKLFNGITNVNLHNNIICFDIKDLQQDGDSQPVAMFNILSFLWEEITRDRITPKKLYVDEAHLLMRSPKSALFLLDVYKRIRKYAGEALVASQQPIDFLGAVEDGHNVGKAILNNSISMLLLGLQDNDIRDLKEYDVLRLSEEEEAIIGRRRQGEGIYVAGHHRVYIRVDATPEELQLIDPKQYVELFEGGA
ncbi:MAG: VirB4 family type IV secretion system protein [Ectobacillus sp.]